MLYCCQWSLWLLGHMPVFYCFKMNLFPVSVTCLILKGKHTRTHRLSLELKVWAPPYFETLFINDSLLTFPVFMNKSDLRPASVRSLLLCQPCSESPQCPESSPPPARWAPVPLHTGEKTLQSSHGLNHLIGASFIYLVNQYLWMQGWAVVFTGLN